MRRVPHVDVAIDHPRVVAEVRRSLDSSLFQGWCRRRWRTRRWCLATPTDRNQQEAGGQHDSNPVASSRLHCLPCDWPPRFGEYCRPLVPAGRWSWLRNPALVAVLPAWLRFVDVPADASQKPAQESFEPWVRGETEGLACSERGFLWLPGLVQAARQPGQRFRHHGGIDVELQGLEVVRNRLRLPPVVVLEGTEPELGKSGLAMRCTLNALTPTRLSCVDGSRRFALLDRDLAETLTSSPTLNSVRAD